MTKKILFFIAGLLLAVLQMPAKSTFAADIQINENNFPDLYFRHYIGFSFDTNQDGKLSDMEREQVISLDVGESSEYHLLYEYPMATTLSGIEYFPNLEILDCSNNGLAELDISRNQKLKELYCNMNNLDKLNVSKNTKLRVLDCSNNSLITLHLQNNSNLTQLSAGSNKLKKLNVSKQKNLIKLYCGQNKLKKLNVSQNRKLLTLSCYENKIKSLDLRQNKSLDYLSCFQNCIRRLDLRNNHLLQYLYCEKNQIITGNLQLSAVQLNTYNVSGQTKKVKVKKRKKGYLVPLTGIERTNVIQKLSKGRITSKGIRLNGKKLPKKITYEYNMFNDGKKRTKVVLNLKK